MKVRLKRDEVDYLKKNAGEQTIEEMAKVLGRPKETIRAYVMREGLPTTIDDRQKGGITKTDLRVALQNKPFYSQVKQQLSRDELLYFEEMWMNAVEQFEMDIRPTEELQLKRLILLDIQADRINIQKKQQSEALERMQLLLNKELNRGPDDRDRDIITTFQSEIAAIRSAVQNLGRESKDLVSESKHIQKDLKATRDQRADTIDDSKMNFVSWLKVVQDSKFRKKVSAEMEVLKLSTKKAKEKLSEYVEFADHTVERQLINHETVMRGEDNNEGDN